MSPSPEWEELRGRVAADGLPVRDAHSGTLDKLYWWQLYLWITTRALAAPSRGGQWPHRINYIDMFAGPGILKVEGNLYPGSPMVATHTPHPIDRLVFCEKDPALADALSERLVNWGAMGRSEVIRGDCNDSVLTLAATLTNDALSLAFIDPTGLQFRWESLVALTRASKVDFLILIPDRMDIVRNFSRLSETQHSRLDAALGADSGWREELAAVTNHTSANICKGIADVYRRRLKDRLGFSYTGLETIRSGSGAGRGLYTILFASRNPLGLKFWNECVKEMRKGPYLL